MAWDARRCRTTAMPTATSAMAAVTPPCSTPAALSNSGRMGQESVTPSGCRRTRRIPRCLLNEIRRSRRAIWMRVGAGTRLLAYQERGGFLPDRVEHVGELVAGVEQAQPHVGMSCRKLL